MAEACGGQANLEPRFTDAPWKMALFTQAITQTRKIGVVLAAMEWSVSEGNSKEWSSEFLEARKSPEFEKMFTQLLQELNGVKEMVIPRGRSALGRSIAKEHHQPQDS